MGATYIPISRDVLRAELAVAINILQKWHAELEEGIPGIEKPGSIENVEEFLKVFYGELLIVSGKCENIANVIGNQI